MFKSSDDTARTAQQIPAAKGPPKEATPKNETTENKNTRPLAEKGAVVGLENLEPWTRESSRAESIMSIAAPSSTQSGNHILQNHIPIRFPLVPEDAITKPAVRSQLARARLLIKCLHPTCQSVQRWIG